MEKEETQRKLLLANKKSVEQRRDLETTAHKEPSRNKIKTHDKAPGTLLGYSGEFDRDLGLWGFSLFNWNMRPSMHHALAIDSRCPRGTGGHIFTNYPLTYHHSIRWWEAQLGHHESRLTSSLLPLCWCWCKFEARKACDDNLPWFTLSEWLKTTNKVVAGAKYGKIIWIW